MVLRLPGQSECRPEERLGKFLHGFELRSSERDGFFLTSLSWRRILSSTLEERVAILACGLHHQRLAGLESRVVQHSAEKFDGPAVILLG